MRTELLTKAVIGIVLLAAGSSAHAYIGPGAGLGAIGTIVALLGGVILAIVGFVWYPIKRLTRRSGKRKENKGDK